MQTGNFYALPQFPHPAAALTREERPQQPFTACLVYFCYFDCGLCVCVYSGVDKSTPVHRAKCFLETEPFCDLLHGYEKGLSVFSENEIAKKL